MTAQEPDWTTCHFGHCTTVLEDGRIMAGFGPVMCPCDNLPGWHAKYPEATPRPRVPALPKGRHGSRVQRSMKRHALPVWEDWKWLEPVSTFPRAEDEV